MKLTLKNQNKIFFEGEYSSEGELREKVEHFRQLYFHNNYFIRKEKLDSNKNTFIEEKDGKVKEYEVQG